MKRQSKLVGTITLLAMATATVAIAFGEVSLQPGHPANRLEGIKVIGLAGGVLTVETSGAASGRVVLKADQPLLVTSVSGGSNCPRWDGEESSSACGRFRPPGNRC